MNYDEHQRRTNDQILATLAELGGKVAHDDDIVFEGKKFVVPENMTIKSALSFLADRAELAEKITTFSRTFKYRPWDGAAALQRSLKRVFGMTGAKAIQTMFGDIPPKLVTINVGVNETEQVPWGIVTLPMLENTEIYTGSEDDPELGKLFTLNVNAPRKFRAELEGLFALVEHELATNSIYRGKAINGAEDAEFLDLSGVDPSKVIYSEDTKTQLQANVWTLLERSDLMRELGIPLKRAVLLEGPFGTGKTLGAMLTAKIAANNGWTFLMCRPGRDNLEEVMATARLYQPAVVFFEDVDTISSTADDDQVTRVLDLFDGLTSKGTEIVAVLTTNHVERIHKGMVRPGRLDSIVHIGHLDAQGVQALIESHIPVAHLAPNIDFNAVWESMEGYLPAFVKEAADRAMRYAIARDGRVTDLTTHDFVNAAVGLRPQFELMQGAKEGERPDNLSEAFKRIVDSVAEEVLNNTQLQHTNGEPQGLKLAVVEEK